MEQYNAVLFMTVKELTELLEPLVNGDIDVGVRCRWHGHVPPSDEWEIDYVSLTVNPETQQQIVTIQCSQEGI